MPNTSRGTVLRRHENFAADLEQDARQQRRSQRRRNAFDQALEAAGHPAHQHQHRTSDVGANGLAVADPAQAGDQQRCAGVDQAMVMGVR